MPTAERTLHPSVNQEHLKSTHLEMENGFYTGLKVTSSNVVEQ